MNYWLPSKEWLNKDAFIIGGGPSLMHFNWKLLIGRSIIGCNAAFMLGEKICPICFFSDRNWYLTFKDELKSYKGHIVTHNGSLNTEGNERLNIMKRYPSGLHIDGLGFNGSSGAGAINLALLMGAKRVFLLGFDCNCKDTKKPNWHDHSIEKLNPDVYSRFLKGFACIARNLANVFPGTEIINVTNCSLIPDFPKITVKQFIRDF